MIQMKWILLIVSLFFFVGCGLNPQISMLSEIPYSGNRFQNLSVLPKNTALMPQDEKLFFKKELEGMFLKNGFSLGEELKIQYSILSYREGNAFTRWLLGSLAKADGRLEVEVIFANKENQELEKVRYNYMLEGSETMKDVLKDLAQKIYDYAKERFLTLKTPNAS